MPKKLDPLEPLDGFNLLAMFVDVWVAEPGCLEAPVVVFVAAAGRPAVTLVAAADAGPADRTGLSAFNLQISYVLTFAYGFDPEFFSRP